MHSIHRPMSTRARILGAILLVASVGLTIVGGVTFVAQRQRVLSAVDDRLQTQVSALRTVAGTEHTTPSTPASRPGQPATSTQHLDIADYTSVSAYLSAAVAQLVPAHNEASVAAIDGQARYRPETISGFDISTDQALIRRATAEADKARTAVLGTARTPQGSLRYIAVPVSMPGDPGRGLYLRAVDLDAELAPVQASMVTYAIAALAVLAAIGLVGWYVAGRLLSPLRNLRETADSITLTDLGARIRTVGDDDISDLTRTVNSMLDRLEQAVDAQRRLLDDVRHELKTPITIVRGHLELMDTRDADDVRSIRDIGIAELDRMTRLVEDIDLLAAVEADEPPVLQTVDVAALTLRVADLVSVIPGHPWRVEDVATATIEGDPDRIVQAWLQLAENAAKYTPEGALIEIGSRARGDDVQLWVRDHGAGIAMSARDRIFRRFDRGGGRRTVGGSGLGLAIVAAIVSSHAGSCAVDDTPGGGATFTISLPRSPHPMGPTAGVTPSRRAAR